MGEFLKFIAELPERFGDRAGQEVAFQVLVKETKRKVLPEPSDDWASEVSEFDTVDALRDDARTRLAAVARVQAQLLVRDKVLDAVADLVDADLPESLVEREVESRVHDLALRAVVVQEHIEANDEEVDREIERLAERVGEKPAKLRRDLERRGVVEAVRSDIARGKALQFLVDHAAVVDEAGDPVEFTEPGEAAAAPEAPPTAGDEAEEHE